MPLLALMLYWLWPVCLRTCSNIGHGDETRLRMRHAKGDRDRYRERNVTHGCDCTDPYFLLGVFIALLQFQMRRRGRAGAIPSIIRRSTTVSAS